MIESSINKNKKIRCFFCKKKCNLIQFECKCNKIFCSVHRYTHMHNCSYIENNIKLKKKELDEKNPKIQKEKINKI